MKSRTINGVKLYLYHDRLIGMYRVHDGTDTGLITVWCQTEDEAWQAAKDGHWA
jgi:hypothetical protein